MIRFSFAIIIIIIIIIIITTTTITMIKTLTVFALKVGSAVFKRGGGGDGVHLSGGWTSGPGEEFTDLHVSVGDVAACVVHLLQTAARVLRTGSISSAQHSQTGYVHLLYSSARYVDRIQLGIRDLKLENFNTQTSNSKTLTQRPQTRKR